MPIGAPLSLGSFTGRACVGQACFDARDIARQLGAADDWRALIRTHGRAGEPAVRGCGGEPVCAPLWLNASARCPDRRPVPGGCILPPPHRRWAPPKAGARRSTCSHSRGEEAVALSYLTGGPEAPFALRGGVYVELGANDGSSSNTRHLHGCLGWRGLLIEGSPGNFAKLQTNRPGAVSLGTAICAEHGTAQFTKRAGVTSGIASLMPNSLRKRFRIRSDANSTEPVPCGPLGDWLALLRVPHIDYFSLDVEGAELVVLRTIDWSRLTVGVLISECAALGCTGPQDAQVAGLLTSHGMTRVGAMRARHDIWNAVFVNRSLGATRGDAAGARWSFAPAPVQ